MLCLCSIPATIVLSCVVPLLSGCAAIGAAYGGETAYNAAFRTKIEDPSKLSAIDQLKLKEVKFIGSADSIGGNPKGEVIGLACKLTVAVFVFKWTWRPELNEINGTTPEEAARSQLLLKAMQKGANAVVAPSCIHNDGIDWGNNCFESWVCTGQAVALP
jgi:hypothetical protein